MKPHLCTQCHYRNSTYIGRDELTASCDHPELQPEGRDLTVTEFQAPDWCPLGLVQPIKQGRLIDLPENPTVVLPEGDGLKKALAEWFVRGNMVHENKPDPRVPVLVVEGTQVADDLVVLDRTAEYGDPSVTKQEDFVWPDSPDPWKDDLDRVVTDPKDERYDPLVIREKLTELQDARVILAMQKATDQAFSIKIPSFETSTEPATPEGASQRGQVKRKSSVKQSVKARAWEFAASLLELHARADRGGVTPDLEFLPELEHIREAVIPALRRRAEIIERNQSKRKKSP